MVLDGNPNIQGKEEGRTLNLKMLIILLTKQRPTADREFANPAYLRTEDVIGDIAQSPAPTNKPEG